VSKKSANIQKPLPAFSLIEVVVVIAIVSILSITIAVSFSSMTPKNLETQTRKLANDLRWVRDMASAQHRNFIIEFVPGQRQYLIYKDSVAAANLVERRSLEVNSLAVTPAALTRLQFNYPKATITANANIVLGAGSRTKTIIVFSETGYIYCQ